MRSCRARFEFGVRLRSQEPRVVFELDHFHNVLVRRNAANVHAVRFELVAIVVVDFVTVAVTFVNELLTVSLIRFGILRQNAGVLPQTHGAAEVCDVVLVGHQVNHRVFRVGVNFRGVRVGKPQHVARKFNDGDLKS